MASLVEYGRRNFAFISVGLQDSSRGEEAFLLRAAVVAAELKVNRLRLADTVGVWNPFQVEATITKLRQSLPELPLGFHAHNDLGMATANTLAARTAGVVSADVTVNGLGERAGNAPLEEVVMAMHVSQGESCGIERDHLRSLAALVARASRRPIPEGKPVTGRAAFRHASGIHVRGWLRDPSTYEAFTPESVGRRGSRIVIGKHSGRAALRHALETQGVEVTATQLTSLLTLVRSNAESRKRPLSLRQLILLAQEVGLKLFVDAATHADMPAMAKLLEFLFEQEADFTPDREKQCRGLALILDNPQLGRIFVARIDGRVVGMVSLLLTVSTAEGAAGAWLEDMVVHPDHRSHGIGSRLLQQAIDEAWGMGVRRITLLTDHDNLTGEAVLSTTWVSPVRNDSLATEAIAGGESGQCLLLAVHCASMKNKSDSESETMKSDSLARRPKSPYFTAPPATHNRQRNAIHSGYRGSCLRPVRRG